MTQVTLNCTDGTSFTIVVDADTLTGLVASVQGMVDYPAGLNCTLIQVPLLTLFGHVAVAANPNNGLNCFWQMPFRQSARLTLENRGPEACTCYYQVNYTLTDVPDDAAYFHAQFRRTNPVPYKGVHTVLDGVSGAGQYVGTHLAEPSRPGEGADHRDKVGTLVKATFARAAIWIAPAAGGHRTAEACSVAARP